MAKKVQHGGLRRVPSGGQLQRDVAIMLAEAPARSEGGRLDLELAHDIIVVVRERVLRELESYARQHIR